jgi:UDP-N-acetylglucosamine--N-acetylmuramyl-(pentapeptide) pyrophosphoryl-undecaprenol N-acetylglucosamine transferase
MANKTILIAAGGTGGHLYPAMAVAEEIRRERPDVKVIFVGTGDRIESREVPRAGFDFFPISIEAPRKSMSGMIKFPLNFAKATLDSMRIFARERPAAMLGGGAYLSVPVGMAAWSFHTPLALLEINSVVGSANKFLAPFSDKAFVAYKEAIPQFNSRIAKSAEVCGTPVRPDLGGLTISQQDARTDFGLDASKTTVLVFGGSLGAGPINRAMAASAKAFAGAGYNVLWQTGKTQEAEDIRKEFEHTENVKVVDYIYEMERAYLAADLVVCRAGASSLAEVARLRKPTVLVPWSGAMANHQEANAIAFAQDGAAVVIKDSEVGSKLQPTVLELLNDGTRLRKMSESMAKRDTPDAAKIVAHWLLGFVK